MSQSNRRSKHNRGKARRPLNFAALLAAVIGVALPSAVGAPPATSGTETAWRPGYPQAGLKNARSLVEWFTTRAKGLGQDGKLRVLIIGDSLSDGEYHWSHYFRRDLQAAYGNGGPGNIWAA